MAVRPRREPPAFRRCEVVEVEPLTARMQSVTLAGADLVGLTVDEPAASVRLLVPRPGEPALVLPTWNGNEFLDSNGARPPLRTFTPLAVDPVEGRLTLQIVRHGGGAVAGWAETASAGDPAAISGPGRGHAIDPTASSHVLLGDETAIPAMAQLLEAIPDETPVEVHVEVVTAAATLPLPDHPRATVEWHVNPSGEPGGHLLAALREAAIAEGTHVWAAGEAAAVQAIRRHLFDERAIPRAAATVRGYWKRR